MFTKLQIYIVICSIVMASGVFCIYQFYLAPSIRRETSVSSSPNGDSAEQIAGSRKIPVSSRVVFPSSYFQLTIKSLTVAEDSNGKKEANSTIEVKYTNQKTEGGILISLYSLGFQHSQDGKIIEDNLMTRDTFVTRSGQRYVESTIEQLPSEQQELMVNGFATYLCKILQDENLNELGREILSDAGYNLLKEGNLASLRLVHGPYYHGTNHWFGMKRLPMPMGLSSDCLLDYTRSTGGNSISITGSLEKPEAVLPYADITIRNLKCELSGEETFDEALAEYTAGKLKWHYKFQGFQKGVQRVTWNEEIELTLKQVTNR